VLVDDIHHVSLNVADTERALGFYRDLLGLTPIERPDFPFAGAWLDAGGGRQVHLIEADVPHDHGQHVAFRVAHLDGVVAAVRGAGFEVGDPSPVGNTGIRQAFVVDTEGNRVEFTQLPT
jgi:glyoxylase I family protein